MLVSFIRESCNLNFYYNFLIKKKDWQLPGFFFILHHIRHIAILHDKKNWTLVVSRALTTHSNSHLFFAIGIAYFFNSRSVYKDTRRRFGEL